MLRRIAVQKGQRYIQEFENKSRKPVWEVTSLSLDMARIQHARLVKVGDRSEVKTLSCFALDGKHGFNLTNT